MGREFAKPTKQIANGQEAQVKILSLDSNQRYINFKIMGYHFSISD